MLKKGVFTVFFKMIINYFWGIKYDTNNEKKENRFLAGSFFIFKYQRGKYLNRLMHVYNFKYLRINSSLKIFTPSVAEVLKKFSYFA